MITGAIDITGLNRLFGDLQEALLATGNTGDLVKIVPDEARRLALECMTQLGPKTKERGIDAAARDLKRVFAPGPTAAFEQSKRKPVHGEINITWLYAGPNFLVYAKDDDIRPSMDIAEMEKVLGSERRGGFVRGRKAWIANGKRGKQSVYHWNRIIVARERFQRTLKKITSRIGRLRATFAYAAFMLGEKRIPSWIKTHFESVAADGRAVFNASRLHDANHPTIEFGSTAPGIHRFEKQIVAATERRKYAITARIHHLFRLYGEDVHAGKKIRSRAADTRTENERMFDAA